MPRYRAELEFTDDQGRERREVVEISAPTDCAEDIARAMQEQWPGFQQMGEERLPHNINWERLDEEEA